MIPRVIRNEVAAAHLHIEWEGGRVQRLSHQFLRGACPCAHCRAKRLRDEPLNAPETVRLTGITSQGYGLQLAFDDTHASGIYPWVYLAGLDTCHMR